MGDHYLTRRNGLGFVFVLAFYMVTGALWILIPSAASALTEWNKAQVLQLKKGEILVCDALDPNMTFIVPLSSGIVERRGGMLIHGAIIAREYGLPCVTGIPEATSSIHSGNEITVDGYLGIVIVE